jgi:hypothetical protein
VIAEEIKKAIEAVLRKEQVSTPLYSKVIEDKAVLRKEQVSTPLYDNVVEEQGYTLAHLAAKHGCLPNKIKLFSIKDASGRTAAHEAAKYNHLPANFSLWKMESLSGWTVAHELAYYHTLPLSFPYWALCTEYVAPVAVIAFLSGHPPDGFDMWDIQTYDNQTTLAHILARAGLLPLSFDKWDILDGSQESVAGCAVRSLRLPDTFTRFSIKDKHGDVLDRLMSPIVLLSSAVKHERIKDYIDKLVTKWSTEGFIGYADEDVQTIKKHFPAVFTHLYVEHTFESENALQHDLM